MRIFKNRFFFLVIVLLSFCVFSCPGYAEVQKALFDDAVESARQGNIEYAFMGFHSLLKKYTEACPYYKDALFAAGEYHFLSNGYNDAEEYFTRYIEAYPNEEKIPFALAYLLKISRNARDEVISSAIEKKIIEWEQLTLLFSEFKEHKYISPLYRKHTAMYFIDRIEFYIDGKLFEKIQF
ncbi:MAG: hypothetical protein GY853_10260 [PVC group bacterium]|nr:hypothetical protein [PVC group bacterium]